MFMCFDLRDVFREVIVTAAEIFVVILTLTFFGSAFALAAHSRRQASRAEVPIARPSVSSESISESVPSINERVAASLSTLRFR